MDYYKQRLNLWLNTIIHYPVSWKHLSSYSAFDREDKNNNVSIILMMLKATMELLFYLKDSKGLFWTHSLSTKTALSGRQQLNKFISSILIACLFRSKVETPQGMLFSHLYRVSHRWLPYKMIRPSPLCSQTGSVSLNNERGSPRWGWRRVCVRGRVSSDFLWSMYVCVCM